MSFTVGCGSCYTIQMPRRPDSSLSHTASHIAVLLEEYRVLYQLAEFRLASLDRRIPLAGAALTTFLTSVPLLPGLAAVLLLVIVPISLVWFLRTTINHARSFEDALRRIEQIERAINESLNSELLRFQSSHPSRGRTVGGRTGVESVAAVAVVSAVLRGACLVLMRATAETPFTLVAAAADVSPGPVYAVYVAGIAAYLVHVLLRWRRYRYEASAPSDA